MEQVQHVAVLQNVARQLVARCQDLQTDVQEPASSIAVVPNRLSDMALGRTLSNGSSPARNGARAKQYSQSRRHMLKVLCDTMVRSSEGRLTKVRQGAVCIQSYLPRLWLIVAQRSPRMRAVKAPFEDRLHLLRWPLSPTSDLYPSSPLLEAQRSPGWYPPDRSLIFAQAGQKNEF